MVVISINSTHEELLDEIQGLRLRLKEAEDALSRRKPEWDPSDAGQPLYRDSSIRDITERKLAAESGSLSQKIFLELIERSPFGTYIVDSQFRIAMMNTASQTGAFRNVQPVIGRDFAEAMRILWPEEVASEIIGNFRHTLDTGEAFYSRDFVNPRQDTEIVEGYEWELHRMTLPDGLYGVICYYYDSTELRQAEAALRPSEERFRVAQELSPDGFFILRPVRGDQGDIEDFTWVYENATMARLNGTDPNAVVGRRLLELLPGHAQSPFYEAYIQVANTGEPGILEASYHGDSIRTITWLRVAVVPIGKDIAVLAQDITARKQAEEELHLQSEAALRLSEQEFRSLAEAVPQIVWATRPDGWNIYFNQQWVEYTGLSMEESYGHGWNTPFHPDDKQRAWEAWHQATHYKERYSMECRLRRADGAYRWWLVRGEPMRGASGEILKWFGTCTDIEELKRAEALLLNANHHLEKRVAERTTELMESEKQFRVLTQNLQSAVALINENGEFRIVNRAFLRIFELDENATIKNLNDRDWSQWKVFDENGVFLDVDEHPVRKAALTGKQVRDVLVAVQAPENPNLKWLLVSAEPVLDAKGHIHLIICTYHDITERKHYQEALERMNQELEARVAQRTAELRERDQMLLLQSRQAAMGEMIGNIAHQWRQPLNTLGLSIQQLELYYELGEFSGEFLAKSVGISMDLIEYMSKTIDDFRNYFKPDKEKVEFKVREAVENSLSLIGDSFRDKLIVVEVTANGDPVIYGYRNEFAQGILNILNNAGDVLLERETPQPKVTITFGTEGDHSFVTIADNAGGIPEGIVAKVFDPYFTTKGPQQGTGVGLYMSKTIIEKNMGGKLSVKNLADGAEFRIEV